MSIAIFLLGLICIPTMVYGFALPKLCLIAGGVAWEKPKRRLPWPAIACVVWACASAVFARDPILSLVGVKNAWAYGLIGILLCVMAYQVAEKKHIQWAGWGAIAVAVLAILDWRYKVLTPQFGGRACSTIGNPPQLGSYLALFLPAAGPFAPVIFAGILASGSRSALIAGAIGWMWEKREIISLKRLIIIATITAYFIGVMMIVRPATFESDTQRMEAWKVAVREWDVAAADMWDPVGWHPERSLFGLGPDNFVNVWFDNHKPEKYVHVNAHNDILQALSTIGWVGMVFYIWLWVWVFRRNPPGSLIALFVAAKFNPMPLEVLAIGSAIAGAYLGEKNAEPI